MSPGVSWTKLWVVVEQLGIPIGGVGVVAQTLVEQH